MTFPERAQPHERLPNELIVRVLLDDRRIVLGEELFDPIDVAAVFADFNHPHVDSEDTRDLIRRLLKIHDRRMQQGKPIKEGIDDDEL